MTVDKIESKGSFVLDSVYEYTLKYSPWSSLPLPLITSPLPSRMVPTLHRNPSPADQGVLGTSLESFMGGTYPSTLLLPSPYSRGQCVTGVQSESLHNPLDVKTQRVRCRDSPHRVWNSRGLLGTLPSAFRTPRVSNVDYSSTSLS